jgi:hypothetical protein
MLERFSLGTEISQIVNESSNDFSGEPTTAFFFPDPTFDIVRVLRGSGLLELE